MKTIIRGLLVSVFILIFSSIVHAQEFGSESAGGFFSEITDKPYTETDMAHKAIVSLFGGFVFDGFGNAPDIPVSLLSHILGYVNLIALLLGVVIMIYVVMTGAVNTASSGQILGKNWSSVWLPLRTATAFGLVMPAVSSSAGTFSVAQILVIKLIIIGSNSATWVWERGAELIVSGAPVMSSTVYYDANSFMTFPNLAYCSAVYNKIMAEKNDAAPIVATAYTNEGDLKFYEYADLPGLDFGNVNRIDFDKCGSLVVPSSKDLKKTQYENIRLGAYSSRDGSWESDVQEKFNLSVKTEIGKVFTASLNYADYLLNEDLNELRIQSAENNGGEEARKIETEILEAAKKLAVVDTAFDNYISAVRAGSVGESVADKWQDQMTKGGWVRAGVWFFEASRYQGFIQTLMTKLSTTSEYSPAEKLSKLCLANWFSGCDERNKLWANLISGPGAVNLRFRQFVTAQDNVDAKGSGTSKILITSPAGSSDKSGFSPDITSTISSSVSQAFINGLMHLGEDDAIGTGGSVDKTTATSVTNMISPFTAVSAIGRGLQQITTTLWVSGIGVSAAVGAFESTGAIGGLATGGVGGAFMGVAKYMLTTIAPIMTGLLALSYMLAFAIPFMPIVIWIMLVIGYLVLIIEAMAAVPLAVIMMATPEGEGVAGANFQKALQMINGIILRPTLSIVGLFAALSLGYVAFSLLNALFWSVADMTTGGSLFEISALITTYSLLAFKVCEYVLSVIHKIPDQIMEWMGGGMSRAFGEQAAEEGVTSAMKGGSAATGLAATAGVAAAGKKNSTARKPVKKEEAE